MLGAAAVIWSNKKNRELIVKGLIALVAIALLIYIYRQVKRLMSINRAESEMEVVQSDVTLSPNQAQAIADTLETAMQETGTNDQLVIDTLQTLQTPSDLALVVQTFGRRENCSAFGLFCNDGNLFDWFTWEFYGTGSYEPGFGILEGAYYQGQLEDELARLGFQIAD